MRGVTHDEYTDFLARHRTVSVGRSEIRLKGYQRPKVLQPEDFKLETTTLWSFPKRGKWATHRSGYRGNWAPQIARNIILRYSQPGDLVLDQMVGGGTTLVECKLTGRDAIGVDVNRDALMLTMDALNFSLEQAPAQGKMLLAEKQAAYRQAARSVDPEAFRQDQEGQSSSGALVPSVNGGREGAGEPSITLYQGDARNLDAVPDASVGLVATHPPYANIIRYTKGADERNPNDLSNVRSIAEYAEQMRRVAEEAHRVLKPGPLLRHPHGGHPPQQALCDHCVPGDAGVPGGGVRPEGGHHQGAVEHADGGVVGEPVAHEELPPHHARAPVHLPQAAPG